MGAGESCGVREEGGRREDSRVSRTSPFIEKVFIRDAAAAFHPFQKGDSNCSFKTSSSPLSSPPSPTLEKTRSTREQREKNGYGHA